MSEDRALRAGQRRNIDAAVGRRIRRIRVSQGMTQEALGARLGVSYQQVQKYETGANRMNAGRLWEVAEALTVDITALFADLDSTRRTELLHGARDRMTLELSRAFAAIDRPELKAAVLGFVRSIADTDPADLELTEQPAQCSRVESDLIVAG